LRQIGHCRARWGPDTASNGHPGGSGSRFNAEFQRGGHSLWGNSCQIIDLIPGGCLEGFGDDAWIVQGMAGSLLDFKGGLCYY